jgi:amino acid adenylation domain-containing protein
MSETGKIQAEATGLEIAVIGMAGRFPGAENISRFWENLRNGVESITFLTPEQLLDAGVEESWLSHPYHVPSSGGVLEDTRSFDAVFFDYLPLEAEVMDPQMRLLHECAWTALEDAGYDPGSYPGSIGLYAGASSHLDWQLRTILSGKMDEIGLFTAQHLTDRDFLCTRVSYKLDLKGPAVTLQTACSTSLVAIYHAGRALLSGECDIALAGGVSVSSRENAGYIYEEGMILSKDGHCRAFDAEASGAAGGRGVGIVVLKGLEDALEDRDHIYAVIKGSAINNDGSDKIGYSAPSVDGQAEVIEAALQMAEVAAEEITYVEAHGTGTPLGDPIEIEALTQAFNTDQRGYCAVGSVKTNFGHLDAAAGVAGFIKTVLALFHGEIPPSLNFKAPNPKIDFDNSPFYVNAGLKPWETGAEPLRAGVSSFGIGGTNAHVVLEQAPALQGPGPGEPAHRLLILSARTQSALERRAVQLAEYLTRHAHASFPDVAYTLQVGRKPFEWRWAKVCAGAADAVTALTASPLTASSSYVPGGAQDPPVVFMFPGQGAQYENMCLDLYRTQPVFKEETDYCLDILASTMDIDVKSVLFPAQSAESGAFTQTQFTQPLLFTIEYALAKLLMHWGIHPDAMIGHSIGEYVAAHLAGVFSLEDALELVAERGRLMQGMPPGSMLGVSLAAEQLKPMLSSAPSVSLAAVNSPGGSVVSGSHESIDAFEQRLTDQGVQSRRLHTSHAFHSEMMGPVLAGFGAVVEKVKLNKPVLPFISNLSGAWITAQQATDPGYWVRHLRHTVRFSDGVSELLKAKNPGYLFLEVGPGRTLSTFLGQHRGGDEPVSAVNLVRHPREKAADDHYLLEKLGQVWLSGKNPDWPTLHAGKNRRRVPLPTYPFEGRQYWIEGSPQQLSARFLAGEQALKKNPDIHRWFYVPSWKRGVPLTGAVESLPGNGAYLVFTAEDELGERLIRQLEERGASVVTVFPGLEFSAEHQSLYRVNPGSSGHYDALVRLLEESRQLPDTIVHLWHAGEEAGEKLLEMGFYSLLHLAKSIGKANSPGDKRMVVISDGLFEFSGAGEVVPEKAMMQALVKVIPQEYSNIRCGSIDIGSPGNRLVNRLTAELTQPISRPLDSVAYRGNHRWIRTFEPLRLEDEAGTQPPMLKEGGVYLITGGLGNIGSHVARYLAEHYRARLILTGRTVIGNEDPKAREIEAAGAEVTLFDADTADMDRMRTVLDWADKERGGLDGIIHCAGVVKGMLKPLNLTDKGHCEEQFHAKLYGLKVLDALLREREQAKRPAPGFCVLMSSLSSVLGGLGFSAYAAANLYMDAFAVSRGDEIPTRWLSVDWDGWEFENPDPSNRERLGITPQEGVKCLEYLFSSPPVPQLIVSTGDLQQRLERWVRLDNKDSAAGGAVAMRERPDMTGSYEAPTTPLQKKLVEIWQEFFGIEPIGIHDDFFQLGGDSLKGMTLVNRYKKLLDAMVYIQVVFDAPTIAQLASFFMEHYPKSVAAAAGEQTGELDLYPEEKVDAAKVARVRKLIQSPPIRKEAGVKKHKPVIFVLSPTRSGSTLLRVILGGHRRLFAPPELNLLSANTLDEISSKGEGEIRAIMQLKGCDVEEAKQMMAEFQDKGMTTGEFYGLMESWLGERILVDKSPLYSYSPDVLKRAEEEFMNARYIHLVRHPYGMIRSKEDAKLNLIQGALKDVGVSRYEVAELEWIICNRNILEFLKGVPEHRHMRVRFEDLVRTPQEVCEAMCRFLGLEIDPEMLEPYKDKKERMTDGIHDQGIMMGDPKFHQHKKIDPAIADRWKKHIKKDFLSDISWQLAESFGYERWTVQERRYVPLDPIEERAWYPLSSAQRRLYVLYRMDLESIVYNLPGVLLARERIDLERLEKVFRQLIQRHEVLRTSFELLVEEPVQRVHEDVVFEIEEFSLEKGRAGEGGTVTDGWLWQDSLTGEEESVRQSFIRPFDLAHAPLLRVGVLRAGQDRTILLLDKHHIISDGTSHQLLIRDFMELYKGNVPEPLKLQYKDFAGWQNRMLQSGEMKKEEEYWLNRFSDIDEIPKLDLPADFSRPAVLDFEGDRHRFVVENSVFARFREWNRGRGATLYMSVLALFNVLLYKYTGQRDIVVGGGIAGRQHVDLQDVIGLFVNALAMRNPLTDGMSYREFLAQVKENSLKAFENQDLQFEELVDRLDIRRDPSRNPLFDVSMVVQNFEKSSNHADNEEPLFVPLHFENRTAKFDLTLFVFEVGDELRFSLEYRTKLFREETIQRFARHLLNLMEVTLDHPELELAEIDILMEDEKQMLVEEFNRTETPYPSGKTLHGLVEEQARRTPDHAAVTGTAGIITYRELDERANRVANYLSTTADGQFAGIVLDRSVDFVVSALGIMKSGRAYVPLSPSLPEARSGYMIRDAGIGVIISNTRHMELLNRLREDCPCLDALLCLDGAALEYPAERLLQPIATGPGDIAYLIYTSGTTGRPKGVVIEHRGFACLKVYMENYVGVEKRDHILQFADISFDSSVWETFMALMTGAVLVSIEGGALEDYGEFIRFIKKQQVTVATLPPPFVAYLEVEEDLPLRLMITAGSESHFQLVEKWSGQLDYINGYGPTENTICATLWRAKESPSPSLYRSVPIGKPMYNTRVFILDSHQKLQLMGVPGELCISGTSVARGYLNRPQLTAEKFIRLKGIEESPIRLYRTGDLARWLPDGNIEFLGRIDHQVKIRGYRVEPGEVESLVKAHDQVKQTIVLVHKDGGGEPYLTAYIVPAEPGAGEDGGFVLSELKRYLSRQLPDYMIPAHFEVLEHMPLTPSGKVDRKQLPAPGISKGPGEDAYTAPSNQLEEQLVRIWSEVLKIDGESIGIDMNFFDLGGHSLKATALVTLIHGKMDIKVPLAEVFKTPTVRGLASFISAAQWLGAEEKVAVNQDTEEMVI